MRWALALALLMLGPVGARAQIFARSTGEHEVREALALWAAGEDDRALERLRALDVATPPKDAAALRRGKLRVAQALGRRQPAAILALARLEQRAYASHAAERRSADALAARLIVADLVQEYARRARNGDRLAPAALLAELGAQLQVGAQEAAAEDLFRQALALDSHQRGARLGLAALLEKHGEYAGSVSLLGDLVATAPPDREARLRYALGLLRTGRGADGERELRALARDGTDWVRSLAAQELARLLVARGAAAEALGVLSEAIAVLPCDPSLPVVAAFAGEHAVALRAQGGQAPESLPLDLSPLGTCGEAAESARARYTRPPTGERSNLQATIAAAEPGWRGALRAALGPPAGESRGSR